MRTIKLKIKNERGFVILFAVTIASILLAIAVGASNIAVKELKFGTSVKDANNAFFAADTGIEYVLFNDKPSTSSFVPNPGTSQTWNLVISGLGSGGTSCAKVSVIKDNTSPPATITTIVSKGYNVGDGSCNSTNPNRVERQLETRY